MLLSEMGSITDMYDDEDKDKSNDLFKEAFRLAAPLGKMKSKYFGQRAMPLTR